MLRRLKAWYQRRLLQRHPIAEPLWRQITQALPVLAGLDAGQRRRLRDQTTLFLQQKDFFGAHGLEISDAMALQVAVQACLPVLELDLALYRGWSTVILYPDTFVVAREETDAAGLVHNSRHELAGESWEDGPVVLSWADVSAREPPHGPGTNVVIHEFAHKLDMRNGVANGMPALHRGMSPELWAATLSAAYDQLVAAVERGRETIIDPYAAEDPAEFFAVISEYFFAAPGVLRDALPEVYRQLVGYYRQDPAHRQ